MDAGCFIPCAAMFGRCFVLDDIYVPQCQIFYADAPQGVGRSIRYDVVLLYIQKKTLSL